MAAVDAEIEYYTRTNIELSERSEEYKEKIIKLQRGLELTELTAHNLREDNQRAENEYLGRMRELQDDVERRGNDVRELAAENERHHQELAVKEAN